MKMRADELIAEADAMQAGVVFHRYYALLSARGQHDLGASRERGRRYVPGDREKTE